MSIPRLLSLIIAGFNVFGLIIAYLGGAFDGESQHYIIECFLGLFVWLLLSLSCIWFGDEMGNLIIPYNLGRIGSPSPGCMVRFMGWVLLLLPVILVLVKVL